MKISAKNCVVIAFGGNLGNVENSFSDARNALSRAGFREIRFSSIRVTSPVGCVPGTPDFKNAVLLGEWDSSAPDLLRLCQKIEREHGRPAIHSSAESRTLDLDIIYFRGECWNSPELTIPHPRARLRDFVMIPLLEIAPDLFHDGFL